MKEFDELISVADTLFGPGGCPWDKEQTFVSLQRYVLEEAHEVLEAVDEGNDDELVKELGDLFYTVIFYGKVAEKEGKFNLQDIIKGIKEKLIRRHPHIFEKTSQLSSSQVMENWDKIKKKEKGHEKRKSALDGIPRSLHALAKAQKTVRIIKKQRHELLDQKLPHDAHPSAEAVIGKKLMTAVLEAEEAGIDAEGSLRRSLAQLEKSFRLQEE